MNCIFTIVAKNYIGLAQILESSVKEKNPAADFFIFVADDFTIDVNSEDFLEDNILLAREKLNISNETWVDMSFKYDLTEFCTSIKPAAFLYLLDTYEKVIYLDPDIYLYNSLEPVFNMLNTHSIVITPHITRIQEQYTGDLPDSDFLGNGIYNLGFCGIKNGRVAKKMLSWWHTRLINSCYIDSPTNIYTDQKWINFLPSFFSNDELLVTRHLGMNIAPWNFFERKIFLEGDKLMVCERNEENEKDKYPVLFVHFSGYNYKELKEGNVIQNNITALTHYSDVKFLTNIYSQAINSKKEVFDRFIKEDYKYNFFDNQDQIKSFHRRLYRSLVDKGENIPNPFSVGENSFHSKLKRLGMMKAGVINIDKANKNNLPNIDSKLAIFNRLSRICYRILGFEKYTLLLRLFYPFSRYESQIHILDRNYDKENIKN